MMGALSRFPPQPTEDYCRGTHPTSQPSAEAAAIPSLASLATWGHARRRGEKCRPTQQPVPSDAS